MYQAHDAKDKIKQIKQSIRELGKLRIRLFIQELGNLGCSIEQIKKRPQVYDINGKKYDIRYRGKAKKVAGGDAYWYSVAFNVLQDVAAVIYLHINSDEFIKLPSKFLSEKYGEMHPDKSKPDVGIFDIDWTKREIVLKGGNRLSIDEYCYSLSDKDVTNLFL